MYISESNKILVAKNDSEEILFNLKMANRHGLIAGATGTGKTTTVKVLAEGFSKAGVPVFLSDIKGDVSGLIVPGQESDTLKTRLEAIGIKLEDFPLQGFPVRFWDVYGEKGTPIRTTISEIGPDLLARILQLNDTQTAILKVVFKIADDNQLLLININDLKSMLNYVSEHKDTYQQDYGNMTSQSIGTILRNIVALENSGGDLFINEPALSINDLFALNSNNEAAINLLSSVKLVQSPILYSTFMVWLLSDLYETLPEVGDLDKPKMVFFFDEAHLLFDDIQPNILKKIEQVIKLIRSKGIGIYFITQNPSDIPDDILGQLGNKIQHALHAYTPNDQKALKAAANSFRSNPAFDTLTTLQELKTGEALISLLDEQGAPTIAQRALILPCQSSFSPAPDSMIAERIAKSSMTPKYATIINSQSAEEVLELYKKKDEMDAQAQALQVEQEKARQKQAILEEKQAQKQAAARQRALNNVINSVGRQVTTKVVRGILGNILK